MISLNVLVYQDPPNIIERCLDSVTDIVDEKIMYFDISWKKSYLRELREKYKIDKIITKDLSGTVVEEWRNEMMDISRGDWILILDPDEYLDDESKEIVRELRQKIGIVPYKDNVVGIAFPRINNEKRLDGSVALRVGYPDFQVRIFKSKSNIRYSGLVHAPPLQPKGKKFILARGHIIHDKTHETPTEIRRKIELYNRREEEWKSTQKRD